MEEASRRADGSKSRGAAACTSSAPSTLPGEVPIDTHRAFVFPNRVRELRQRLGFPKLLRLSSLIPEIPYIRLSKIERGEVLARADELQRIAAVLGVPAHDLLIDIDSPDFSIARWAAPFLDTSQIDLAEERFAVELAAAMRVRRTGDPELTIAAIEQRHGLAPVNLSRIENAAKPFGRWNQATQQAVFAIFGVADEAELRALIDMQVRSGALGDMIAAVDDPQRRHERSRARIAALAEELKRLVAPTPPLTPGSRRNLALAPPAAAPLPRIAARAVPVLGTPLANGLIAHQPTGDTIELPNAAGARAFALRVCRATLGGGLPAQAIVIIDPDRHPAPGGLAALQESDGWRLLSVGADRDGRMIGYSSNPALEIVLDEHDPGALASIVAALMP